MKQKGPWDVIRYTAWYVLGILVILMVYRNVQVRFPAEVPPIPDFPWQQPFGQDYFDRRDGYRCYFIIGNERNYTCVRGGKWATNEFPTPTTPT